MLGATENGPCLWGSLRIHRPGLKAPKITNSSSKRRTSFFRPAHRLPSPAPARSHCTNEAGVHSKSPAPSPAASRDPIFTLQKQAPWTTACGSNSNENLACERSSEWRVVEEPTALRSRKVHQHCRYRGGAVDGSWEIFALYGVMMPPRRRKTGSTVYSAPGTTNHHRTIKRRGPTTNESRTSSSPYVYRYLYDEKKL